MQQNRPTKEQVRAYTQQRAKAQTPPPSPEEVRRQLGWGMLWDGPARK
jgi:hypothetical protein